MTRYAIVDVANLFHRARHAVGGDAFTKAGMTLHIVFRSLRKLHREHQCDHIVLCLEGKSWRYSVYPQYKSKRKLDRAIAAAKRVDAEEEEVFFQTMDDFAKFMSEKTRCTVLQSDGVEGDDFVARWIQLHPEDEHIILSGDSDFVQLLSPTVSIYNGMDDVLITPDRITDGRGRELVFHVDASKGKVKIGKPLDEAAKDHLKAQKEKKKLSPNHEIEPFSFTPEPEWWRKALFIKIIRGDTSDSVFSAYPGVRYEGSAKKIGIREAWEDRNSMGYHWNNFMLQSWDKLIGEDANGNKQTQRVRVMDEYNINSMLIDLTEQPQEIKDLMDTVIVQAVQKDPVNNVGIAFLRFCNEFQLSNLSKEANDHALYLNAAYSK